MEILLGSNTTRVIAYDIFENSTEIEGVIISYRKSNVFN